MTTASASFHIQVAPTSYACTAPIPTVLVVQSVAMSFMVALPTVCIYMPSAWS